MRYQEISQDNPVIRMFLDKEHADLFVVMCKHQQSSVRTWNYEISYASVANWAQVKVSKDGHFSKSILQAVVVTLNTIKFMLEHGPQQETK